MKTSYLSKEEGLQLVKDWQASGLNQKAFCSEKDINYARFHYWYSVYRSNLKSTAGFVPIKVAPLEDFLVLRGCNGLEVQMSASYASAVFVKQLLTL